MVPLIRVKRQQATLVVAIYMEQTIKTLISSLTAWARRLVD